VPSRLTIVRVTRVIDGDTIRVQPAQGPLERVRLIGIDAPEVPPGPKLDGDAARSGRSLTAIQAMGRRATAFARTQLDRQSVGLDLDVQKRDRYGRLLAYVWTSGGVLFNRLIVAAGYAQVMTIPPNVRYAALLRACEREAREARRGLWGD
jgi:micrococcal nuclease